MYEGRDFSRWKRDKDKRRIILAPQAVGNDRRAPDPLAHTATTDFKISLCAVGIRANTLKDISSDMDYSRPL